MPEGHNRPPPLPSQSEGTDEAPTTPRQLEVTGSFLKMIPRVLLPPAEVNASDLDHRDYFLLSLLDGATTIETVLDICGMPSEEAVALLDGLVRRGIIGFGP